MKKANGYLKSIDGNMISFGENYSYRVNNDIITMLTQIQKENKSIFIKITLSLFGEQNRTMKILVNHETTVDLSDEFRESIKENVKISQMKSKM